MISDRAVIDPGAHLEEDVEIGPFCVIEGDVAIGRGTRIGSHVVIRSGTEIGRNNRIYSFASIGEDPQFAGYAGEPTRLEIGDANVIREYATLNRGSTSDRGTGVTRIGNNNFLMAYSHIAHDSTLGDHIIFANGASLAGHVEVGDFAILGGFTLVHQFCRVGPHSLTGIGTVCLQDVAPYLIVAGSPAKTYGINVRGLRRRDFGDEVIAELREIYKQKFRGKTVSTNITPSEPGQSFSPESVQLLEFLSQSQRGVIR
ncbi:MAG TPA: acyl-[acyl-carrier-protein]--UDP-N-acetylglucosamine O-acyltransferase [Gammaproteobacteria bacterium]|nr:acyl-[acyl-carrier-protein]--UDP-N-acetylglucosamine O-acyltransferase [Acidiferrobacteraceae bacterium]HAA35302.1 acyl-[acyl-carrier-protein]--UDP-N-acetylglucosamine O-acyltransferase [Gammaproteobacteria bacterium]